MALPTKESRWGGLHNGNNQNSLSLARASGKGATTSDYWAPPMVETWRLTPTTSARQDSRTRHESDEHLPRPTAVPRDGFKVVHPLADWN